MTDIDANYLKKIDWVDYNDGDVVIVNDMSNMQSEQIKKRTINLVVLIFCIKGSAEIVLNGQKWKLQKNNVFVCAPNKQIDDYSVSSDFESKIIGFSMNAIGSSIYVSKDIWHNAYYVYQNPVLKLTKLDMQLLAHYYFIAEAKINDSLNIYHKEIMHSLLSCLIYEFLLLTSRLSDKTNTDSGGMLRQEDIIFRRFIELLSSSRGMIRSVATAADKLNISAKYLSAAIKSASGKNALEIIHYYTMQEVIRQLKYTDKTIKEISNDMQFTSMSFFGKFFKSQTGVSPRKYRLDNSK